MAGAQPVVLVPVADRFRRQAVEWLVLPTGAYATRAAGQTAGDRPQLHQRAVRHRRTAALPTGAARRDCPRRALDRVPEHRVVAVLLILPNAAHPPSPPPP